MQKSLFLPLNKTLYIIHIPKFYSGISSSMSKMVGMFHFKGKLNLDIKRLYAAMHTIRIVLILMLFSWKFAFEFKVMD